MSIDATDPNIIDVEVTGDDDVQVETQAAKDMRELVQMVRAETLMKLLQHCSKISGQGRGIVLKYVIDFAKANDIRI
ncbi:hypothetical protein UFOVP594_3 [uncultured Caudovirales phage]|uniref:Uncharacterized protein n=1 Tax=uncultured Caudovirales phage TaxID=2100421 RepID=A0A6J5N1M2_9CAUD|nr:hypothetical protein UFOVP594_3 [uncultured Caudovirales phage]